MASDDDNGFNRLGDRTNKWANRKAGQLADSKHPMFKIGGWLAALVAIIVVINIIGGFISFGSDAVQETRHVLSVQNIVAQRTAIIQDWQDLLVATGNACNAVSAPSNPNSPTFLEDPAFAYAATARNARVDYNRRQHNLFEAAAVGPPGYPGTVPDQAKMDTAHPNWCQIAADLEKTHD